MKTTDLIKQVETQRHSVVVEVFSPTWNELLNQYQAADIEIDPVYQRAFRWDVLQQTQFIESLLLNIPMPPIFLAEKVDGRFEVIDGLQRFSTMVKFFASEIFKAAAKQGNGDNPNDIQVATTLENAPILEGLRGLTRDTMPDTLVRTIRYSRTQVILLKKESSAVAKFNVFTRLNRAGSQLSDQEIRNCSARLFNSTFPDDLRRLADEPSVRQAMALSAPDYASMKVEENLLRLLAFTYSDPATNKINDFLDQFMYQAASGEFKPNPRYLENLKITFDLLAEACPKGEAFKFYKNKKFQGAFSTNLFDIVGCGAYKNLSKIKKAGPALLRKQIVALHSKPEALELTGAGSNTRKKIIGRVSFGHKWFAQV